MVLSEKIDRCMGLDLTDMFTSAGVVKVQA